jgi:acetyl-CoA acyltransferase
MAAKVVIVDGVRSPIGIKNGKLVGLRPDELGAQVVRGLLARVEGLKQSDIGDIVVGCAFPEASQGMLVARGIGVLAGLPVEVPGKVVNRFCGSSMDAVHQVANAIATDNMEIGIAAGIEDMFAVPMGGFNPSFHPQLAEQQFYMGMGETAENLARELAISRADQEEFAMASHRKALAARAAGKLAREIVPVKHNGVEISEDEGPREPNEEKIRSLKPAFLADGTITAATSSPISVGAAALLLASEAYAKANNLPIRAYVTGQSVVGVEWDKMGKGPVPAVAKLLAKNEKTWDDIDVVELNEAFAAQSLYVLRKGQWPEEKVNKFGGAIALGHPLGASGARILVTLLNVMDDEKAKTGIATMCIGTGQGIATLIER